MAQEVFLDGKPVQFDVKPQTINGYMFVPLRGLFDKMGATLTWDQPKSLVTVLYGTKRIELLIGSRIATTNGQRVTAEVAPFVYQAHTMIPLRLIAQATGADVSIHNGKVNITRSKKAT